MKALVRWAGQVPWLWVGLVCGLAVTGSAWTHLSTRLVGEQFLDAMGTQWFYWYAGELFQDEKVGYSRLLFFPYGKAIYLHTGGNLVDALAALPLRWLLGPIAGYNLWVLVLFALNALGAARLAATFRLGHGGQAAAACLFCLNPYLLIELDQGRPTQALAFSLPLALAAMRERRGLLAGMLIGLTGLVYWYYGLLLGAVAVLTGLAMLIEPGRGKTLWSLVLGFWACMLVVLPVALPMFGALGEGSVPGLLRFEHAGFWADTLGGLVLETEQGDKQSVFVATLGGLAGPLIPEPGLVRFDAGARLAGWPQLLLALPGLGLLGRRGAPLVLWALVGVLVGVGPVLWLGGPKNPLYLGLFEHLEFFRRWWWPMRANVLVQIPLAIAAAATVDAVGRALERRLAPLRGRRGPATLLVLPLLGAAWSLDAAPLESWDAQSSPVIAECLRHAPRGAVIDLPLARDQYHLWDQVWHEQPQMGGMLSQKPAFGSGKVDELLRANRTAAMLVAVGGGNYTAKLVDDPADRAALVAAGYRYVLVRHEAYTRVDSRGRTNSDIDRVSRIVSKILGPPAAVDAASPHPVSLWTLDGTPLRCGGSSADAPVKGSP